MQSLESLCCFPMNNSHIRATHVSSSVNGNDAHRAWCGFRNIFYPTVWEKQTHLCSKALISREYQQSKGGLHSCKKFMMSFGVVFLTHKIVAETVCLTFCIPLGIAIWRFEPTTVRSGSRNYGTNHSKYNMDGKCIKWWTWRTERVSQRMH